jgi:hypothetical protein
MKYPTLAARLRRSLIGALQSIGLLTSSQHGQNDDDQSDERNDEGPQRGDGTCETPNRDEAAGEPRAMSEAKRSEQNHASAADK